MSIFRTKRIIAIVIFLAMILTNVAASAGTAAVNESGEGTMSIMPTSLSTYITSFMQVCTEAAVPGEPVKGEYQFDGYNFDTLIPVTVDVPKIKEAFHGLKEDLLKDEAVLASLQGLPQAGGEEFTPENLRAVLDEFETHFPDEVTAEYYQNGDDSIPFYVTGRAVCTGKEEPSYEYSMLRKDEKNYTMSFLDHEHSIVAGLILTDGGIRLEYKQGETNLVIDFMSETGEPAVYRLGTSVYTIRIPDSFTEGNRTEADIRDDMVAYMRSDETLLDFDVYQFTKEGRPDSLAAYAEQEAAEYNAFEVVTGKNINGIDVAWYRAKETYDGKEYTTLNYLFDDGDQYVEIAFWLDGETAEAEAQEIISTLAFIHR